MAAQAKKIRTTGRLSPSLTTRHWHYLPTAPPACDGQTAEVDVSVNGETAHPAAMAAARPAAAARVEAARLILGGALLMGLVLRLAPIVITDFPLRDGGLFVTMARDLQNGGLSPPMYSSFNTGEVPFAYPPLGIIMQALVPMESVRPKP
jgi:hypothetical protein